MKLNRRQIRQVITVLSVSVLLLFVAINILYVMIASKESGTDLASHPRHSDSEHRIAVEVSNIQADTDGQVKIELSLKIDELLKFLEGGQHKHGEATNNPAPRTVNFLINNPSRCTQSKELKYIIYLHTSPQNTEKRELLRNTWANTELFNARIIDRVFLMGKTDNDRIQNKVQEESDKYRDIIQGDFDDNYRNLTLKGLMGLKWVSTYCKQAKFAIKADDDAFVDIFKLLHILGHHEHEEKLLACPLWSANSMPILRDPSKCAKWCVRFSEFPGRKYFPQYCAGLTYVMSHDLVPLMFEASKNTPFFWIDDVYITGILPTKVKNVEYIRLLRNFTLKQDEAFKELQHENQPYTRLFVHAKKPDMFKAMWNLLLERLTMDDLKVLSTDFIEQNAILKRKLSNNRNR